MPRVGKIGLDKLVDYTDVSKLTVGELADHSGNVYKALGESKEGRDAIVAMRTKDKLIKPSHQHSYIVTETEIIKAWNEFEDIEKPHILKIKKHHNERRIARKFRCSVCMEPWEGDTST
jgi:hypothetical protein